MRYSLTRRAVFVRVAQSATAAATHEIGANNSAARRRQAGCKVRESPGLPGKREIRVAYSRIKIESIVVDDERCRQAGRAGRGSGGCVAAKRAAGPLGNVQPAARSRNSAHSEWLVCAGWQPVFRLSRAGSVRRNSDGTNWAAG